MSGKYRFGVGDDCGTFTIRYSGLSHVNKSVATISQGLLGMREGIIGSFMFCCWSSKQVVHFDIMLLI